MRFVFVLSIFSILTLASCTRLGTAPTPLTPTQDLPELSDPESAAIYYHRIGGIAGLDESYWIIESGRIYNDQGEEWTVSSTAVWSLLEKIKQAGFFDVDYESPSAVPCCDRLSYELALMSGGMRKLMIYDGAPDVPTSVLFAFDAVADFIQDHTAP